MAGYYEELGKNKYKLIVELPTTIRPDGTKKRNRRTKTVTATGTREAKKLLANFASTVLSPQYFEPEKISFATFVNDKWWPNYALSHFEDKTLEVYEENLILRIIPALQHFKLAEITTLHLVEFFKDLSEPGAKVDGGSLSGETIAIYHRILRSIFTVAIEWNLIDKNPMDGIKKPKIVNKEVEVYEEDEIAEVFECLKNESLKWQLLVQCTFAGALRRSEVLGLEDRHINVEKGVIHVRQSITNTKKRGLKVKDLKHTKHRRDLHMPEQLIIELKKLGTYKKKERLVTQKAWKEGSYFLFSDETGKPMAPHSVTTWWRRFTEKNNIRHIPFHGIRHTSATLMIAKNVHTKTISARLGHSDVKVTLNRYGHALEAADKAATEETFGNLFERKNG
ncbi:hypothetical protein J1TS1_28650 [Shouchella clausii]|uniref:tyrosine-type recombinase/integrase n=1 Tax=Shouchella TaxID=2893057 RepID=UPI001B24871B|nr:MULTISPECIES: site-specific integrase [Shouchella]GIN08720.1 hypothetical protein J1TS1_28650 [Shouchella clausii]